MRPLLLFISQLWKVSDETAHSFQVPVTSMYFHLFVHTATMKTIVTMQTFENAVQSGSI